MTKLLEKRRLELQTKLDAEKTSLERNKLGQFATPTTLALDILTHARKLLPSEEPIRFLDPAIGTGAFYSALLSTFPRGRVKTATGIEIDPHYGVPARALWANTPLNIELGDFAEQSAKAT